MGKNDNLFIILEILRQWTELVSFLPLIEHNVTLWGGLVRASKPPILNQFETLSS